MSTSILKWVARRRRPLSKRKSAGIAATIGLMFGALGVGLYLRSFVDFTVCFVFTLVTGLAIALTQNPLTLVPYVAGSAIYAFHRVKLSNERLAVPAT